MNRTTHPVVPAASRGFQKFLGAALVAAAAAVPAHASIIDFEQGAFTPAGWSESFQLAGRDVGSTTGIDLWQQGGADVMFLANVAGDGYGYLVGQFMDGTANDVCVNMACPVGYSSTYYGALNDSYLDIMGTKPGSEFKLKSFDASFIGSTTALSTYPSVAGLLRVQGWTATGASTYQDFLLAGPSLVAGGFTFGHYVVPSAFADTAFTQIAMFGFTCNSSGNCNAFTTNKGQFGVDNIELDGLSAVPEPGTMAMIGLGLTGLAGALRRRKA